MNEIGKIVWQDLTVDNAKEVKDFYSEVVGWNSSGVSMGAYDDFNIIKPGGDDSEPVAGICHRRGSNENLPPQWLIYVMVKSVNQSVEKCKALGGKIVDGPRSMGNYQFAVIQDPAGAYMALMEEIVR